MPEQTPTTPDLLDTPIMPTGSGVVDLEVSRELDALAGDESLADGNLADGTEAASADVPMLDDDAARASQAHPS